MSVAYSELIIRNTDRKSYEYDSLRRGSGKPCYFVDTSTTGSDFLTLYVPCIILQCVDKPTRCNTSYE